MNSVVSRRCILFVIILLVIIIDQWSKFWVKTNMHLGENIPILGLSWANIHFVENEGMAFGLSWGGEVGKIILTVFRLTAFIFILLMLDRLIREKVKLGAIVSGALVCAGALGNIIDSVFYGRIFSQSTYTQVATFLPSDGGYAPILQGRVVDMFYFPFGDISLPSWMPILGDKVFFFFRHVFNVADASISIGIVLILIFYRHDIFKESTATKTAEG